MTEGLVIAGGLLGGAQVGDGPTDEQLNVLQGLLHGYLGIDADVTTVEPLSAEELAARVDPEHRKRVVDLLVVVEFCRHSDGEAQADRAEAYARALGVDEPLVQVARDALTDCQQIVMADWSRFSEAIQVEPQAPVADAALAQRLRSLASCPEGSLGRAYFDFYARWDLPFPGEEGGGTATLVAHDFSHVLAGYDADPPSEIALQAMLTAATGFEHHFSGLIASLSLFESGKFDIDDITPRSEAMARPGASAELGDAFRRGTPCTCDFAALDHLALVDEPLDRLREECGIPPRGD